MEFGNKLYEMRKEKGLSQEELARRLEVTRQTVSKWELGDSTPDLDKLVLLAELFEISLDELVLDKVCVVSCVLTGSAYTDPVGFELEYSHF
jgi:transcriptional regulator with XRE-family HTH domain